MPAPKKNNNPSFAIVVIWVLIAVICIQGYFLLQRKVPIRPPTQPVVKEKPLPPKIVKPPVAPEKEGRIAIVIDDWGYNRSHCRYLQAIPVPVGVAIIPGLPYSRDVIDCAIKYGKEPMVHLPIEPHVFTNDYPPGYLLTVDMPQSSVKKLLAKIFLEMKGVVGVNNHMGSKGTEDPVLMTTVLSEIKKRGLFFVDSRTSERSVCLEVANKLKMKIGARDVFIDNRNERSAIEREFARAVKIARERGFALLIGHDRELSLKIIYEEIKQYSAEGIEFIGIRDYIKQYEYPGH